MNRDASGLFLHCLFINIFNVYINLTITHNIIIQEKKSFLYVLWIILLRMVRERAPNS